MKHHQQQQSRNAQQSRQNDAKEQNPSFLAKHLHKIILGVIILIILLIVFGILTAIYSILHLLFPSYISLCVVIFCLHRMIYLVCRNLAFPGSSWLWKRNIEFHFAKEIAARGREKIALLESLIEYLLVDSPTKSWDSHMDIIEIRRMVSSLCHIFMQQQLQRTLSNRQRQLASNFEGLQRALKNANIVKKAMLSADVVPFWTILKQKLDLTKSYEDDVTLYFENKLNAAELLQYCRVIKAEFDDIIEKKSCFKSIYRWMTNDKLGSIDQIRVELETRYDGKNIQIRSERGVVLDGNEEQETNRTSIPQPSEQVTSSRIGPIEESIDIMNARSKGSAKGDDSARSRMSDPTIVLCNPNAGIYEFMYYECEWIDFYINRGLNVFVWNYRGYGRSTGSPSPKTLKKDGEAVINHLRTELGVKKIGVHGGSMGGFVACHLARYCNLDYACVDRTFSSLVNVASIITRWNDDTSENFIQAPCFKVVTFDPKDEVIQLQASLRYSITKRVIERILGIESGGKTSLNFLRKLFNSGYNNLQEQRNPDEYNELLNSSQTEAIFHSLRRVSEVFVEMSKSQQMPGKRHRKVFTNDHAIKNTIQLNKYPGQEDKNIVSKVSLDSSLNLSAIEKDIGEVEETVINAVRPSLKKKIVRNSRENLDDSITFAKGKRIMDESIHIDKLIIPFDKIEQPATNPVIAADTKTASYLNLLTDEEKSSESLQKLTYKLFSLFGSLEAGGIYLVDVFTSNNSFECFKEFLVSLEIWGSYFPLRQIPSAPHLEIEFFHKQALYRVREFIRRLDSVISSHKKQHNTLPLEAKILEDLQVVSSVLPGVYDKLLIAYNKHFNKEEESKESNTSSGADSTHIDRPQSFLPPTRSSSVSLEINNGGFLNFQTLGHLLPLSCGHNGSLNKTEAAVYEHYFRLSGFAPTK